MHSTLAWENNKPEGLSVLSADGPGFKAGFALGC